MRYRMIHSSGYKSLATYSWEEVLNFVEAFRNDDDVVFSMGRVVQVEEA